MSQHQSSECVFVPSLVVRVCGHSSEGDAFFTGSFRSPPPFLHLLYPPPPRRARPPLRRLRRPLLAEQSRSRPNGNDRKRCRSVRIQAALPANRPPAAQFPPRSHVQCRVILRSLGQLKGQHSEEHENQSQIAYSKMREYSLSVFRPNRTEESAGGAVWSGAPSLSAR